MVSAGQFAAHKTVLIIGCSSLLGSLRWQLLPHLLPFYRALPAGRHYVAGSKPGHSPPWWPFRRCRMQPDYTKAFCHWFVHYCWNYVTVGTKASVCFLWGQRCACLLDSDERVVRGRLEEAVERKQEKGDSQEWPAFTLFLTICPANVTGFKHVHHKTD